ncbi:MAG: protein-L-isoaspartate(D-aspartate) O-methyltransferase [Thiotrichales bacterium]|nr:MAG: protein-L-isoaspartate(D-aspartate) O-methyltransferase [Thiotrichales bacterium]
MKLLRIFLLFFCLLAVYAAEAADTSEYARQRQGMVDEIAADARRLVRHIDKDSVSDHVMQVMGTVPRHLFVPAEQRRYAYENRPLPIGYGQTISQPYIVALMTDLLQPRPDHKVLEIGTGSGYQAAVLSGLVDQVYSIEIISELGQRSTQTLKELGYDNVTTRVADGYDGWPEQAPFDSIIVTAGISHIPPPLIRQLKNGGTMVIPVGTRFQTQQLTLVNKDHTGAISTRQIIPVIFVPFTGGH